MTMNKDESWRTSPTVPAPVNGMDGTALIVKWRPAILATLGRRHTRSSATTARWPHQCSATDSSSNSRTTSDHQAQRNQGPRSGQPTVNDVVSIRDVLSDRPG
jgi:hypothetical protein